MDKCIPNIYNNYNHECLSDNSTCTMVNISIEEEINCTGYCAFYEVQGAFKICRDNCSLYQMTSQGGMCMDYCDLSY